MALRNVTKKSRKKQFPSRMMTGLSWPKVLNTLGIIFQMWLNCFRLFWHILAIFRQAWFFAQLLHQGKSGKHV